MSGDEWWHSHYTVCVIELWLTASLNCSKHFVFCTHHNIIMKLILEQIFKTILRSYFINDLVLIQVPWTDSIMHLVLLLWNNYCTEEHMRNNHRKTAYCTYFSLRIFIEMYFIFVYIIFTFQKNPGIILNDPSGYGKKLQVVLFIKAIRHALEDSVLIICNDNDAVIWLEHFREWTDFYDGIFNKISLAIGNIYSYELVVIAIFFKDDPLDRTHWVSRRIFLLLWITFRSGGKFNETLLLLGLVIASSLGWKTGGQARLPILAYFD